MYQTWIYQKPSLSYVIQQGQRRRECNYYKHVKNSFLVKGD